MKSLITRLADMIMMFVLVLVLYAMLLIITVGAYVSARCLFMEN